MRKEGCVMKFRRVAWQFLMLALTVVCAAAFKIPHSPLPTPHSPLPTPHPHKIHVSVTYLEFNQPRQTVEIVIRVFTDDLENALSRGGAREVKIDPASAGKDRRGGDLVMSYLRWNVELKNRAVRPFTLSWAGTEGQMDMFWLYVKGRMPGGLEGAQMRNKIFCELFDDQVNIVNAKSQGKQIGLMFESKDNFKAIR